MRTLQKVIFNLLYWYRHEKRLSASCGANVINHGLVLDKELEQKRQLFVDVSELMMQDAKTGIQRVVRSVLQEWLSLSLEKFSIQPVYASHGEYKYARQFFSRFFDAPVDSTEDSYIEYQAGDVFVGLDFNYDVVFSCKAFYQKMRCSGVIVKFVVYDLLCIHIPKHFFYLAAEKHQRWLEIIAESDGAVCISKAVADELSAWLKVYFPRKCRSFQISWFHLGADIYNSVSTKSMLAGAEEVLRKLQQLPSFLMVGTLEPRKGHQQVLAAFELLWRQNAKINLMIVGKQGWKTKELINSLKQHAQLENHLFWVEDASDEFLEKIYQASDCLIAASEGEGFGLPLIEAARHRLPIIARDIPVFLEVTEGHAFFFKGESPEVLAKAITDWLVLFEKSFHPTSEEIKWLTWQQSAQQLLSCILSNNLSEEFTH